MNGEVGRIGRLRRRDRRQGRAVTCIRRDNGRGIRHPEPAAPPVRNTRLTPPGARYSTDFFVASSISSGVRSTTVRVRTEPEPLTVRPTAAAMLRAAEGTGLYMALLLAVGTGMRKGELLAARWSDVDFEAGTLTVNQTLQAAFGELHFKEPKTAKSRRRITLPGVVVDALSAHRAEQARKILAREPGYALSDLVLAAPRGGPWWPYNFDRMWRKFKTRQGLEIRFHDLRHTHATQLLKAGVHPKVVSERLGHASIGITLDTYSHVMPGMQEEAAEKIDAGLRKALAG